MKLFTQNIQTVLTVTILLFFNFGFSGAPSSSTPSKLDDAHKILSTILKDNRAFVAAKKPADFSHILTSQSPDGTMVMCSDSRVQTESFYQEPINQLFIIRNIRNQIRTCAGSVEYGIRHVNTPLLLIIGHSQCGAIKAALTEHFDHPLEASIQKEIDTLKINPQQSLLENIANNVHQQVTFAKSQYKDKIDQKQLLVVGAIYDFENAFKHGFGKLVVINMNGDKNSKTIRQAIRQSIQKYG